MNSLLLYNDLLIKRPVITKALTGSVIFALGDYLCQEMERRIIKKDKSIAISFQRIIKQASFGLVAAPYLHLQFNFIIPRLFPEGSRFATVKSVAYAVTISDGLFNLFFFSYMCFVNKKTLKQSIHEIPEKYIPVQITNMKVWPFLTGFNFTFIPPNYRVLFDNVLCIFWNIYLSYVENNQQVKEVDNQELANVQPERIPI
jgi:hypothetical protein